MNEIRLANRSHRRRQTVDAQFPTDDVARYPILEGPGYRYCTKKKNVGSKRDRG
jgi:hypothetical protein